MNNGKVGFTPLFRSKFGAIARGRTWADTAGQSEVDRWQQPDIGFFDQFEIPAEVIGPAKTRGLGTSAVPIGDCK